MSIDGAGDERSTTVEALGAPLSSTLVALDSPGDDDIAWAEDLASADDIERDTHNGFRGGDWDFRIAGSGSNDEGWNRGNAALELGVGYFLSDALEVELRQAMTMGNPVGSGTEWNGATRIALDLYLPIGWVNPFVGANFGSIYGDTVPDTLIAAPEVGIKWFLQSDAYLLAMGEYRFQFDDVGDIHDSFNDGTFVYTVGLGLRF